LLSLRARREKRLALTRSRREAAGPVRRAARRARLARRESLAARRPAAPQSLRAGSLPGPR